MYRVYANDRRARINLGIRRRLAPLLGNNRRQDRAAQRPADVAARHAGHLLRRRNRHGRQRLPRRPRWRAHADAVVARTATPGSRRVNPQQLQLPVIIDPEFHFETVNVETQLANPESLLWWMRRTIALRRRHRVFGRGEIEFLSPDNHRVLAFVRADEDEQILVVANLSRFAQHVELDLSRWRGLRAARAVRPDDVPAHRRAAVPAHPRPARLLLAAPRGAGAPRGDRPPPRGPTDPAVRPPGRAAGRRAAPAPGGGDRGVPAAPALVRRQGAPGRAGARHRRAAGRPSRHRPGGVRVGARSATWKASPRRTSCRSRSPSTRPPSGSPRTRPTRWWPRSTFGDRFGLVVDGLHDRSFCELLLETAQRRRATGRNGALVSRPTPAMRAIVREADGPLEPDLFRAEQTNTSVVFGHQIILKVFRRPEAGTNPDLELGLHLNAAGFAHCPHGAGLARVRAAARRGPHARDPARGRPKRGRRLVVHARRTRAPVRAGAGERGQPRGPCLGRTRRADRAGRVRASARCPRCG